MLFFLSSSVLLDCAGSGLVDCSFLATRLCRRARLIESAAERRPLFFVFVSPSVFLSFPFAAAADHNPIQTDVCPSHFLSLRLS